MQFIHTALTWGFLLAFVPLLIHLINLVRRKRIQWAAMDFLLQSYRRHRTWIWLKQLLLLLLRMLAVAVVVAMVAQWVTQQEWFTSLGGRTTHHYVLLDDSYSMGEFQAGVSAYDRASRLVDHIARRSGDGGGRQLVTLIRYSRASAASDLNAEQAPRIVDLNAVEVDGNFDLEMEDVRGDLQLTELADGPQDALRLVGDLLQSPEAETSLVYLLSDFRARDWENPAETQRLLESLTQREAEIHFVDCAGSEQENAGIIDIEAVDETQAAGVPLFVEFTVKNFGRRAIRKLPVQIRTVFYDPQSQASGSPGTVTGKIDQLPSVLIEEIPPGKTVTARTQVFFPAPGAHTVEASLPDDALSADNKRRCVIELADGEPTLIVDGTPTAINAYFLNAAFAPGTRAYTGVRPQIENETFLRDATLEQLSQFRSIYLLDIDLRLSQLGQRAISNLEQYVRDGGGLAFFGGPNLSVEQYNQHWYRNGDGLFPVPLDRQAELPSTGLEESPDLEVEEHPVFKLLLGERNPFIRLIAIQNYLQAPDDWQPPANSTARVLARLRNKHPLVVEKSLGNGRVVVFLTSLSPIWNNWARDPSFVVAMLKLQSYLSSGSRVVPRHLVGTPLDVRFDAARYRPEVVFVVPDGSNKATASIDRVAEREAADAPYWEIRLGNGEEDFSNVAHSGVYEAWLLEETGNKAVQRYALNVSSDEGNLTRADQAAAVARLTPVKPTFHQAEQFAYETVDEAGTNRSLLLLGILVLLLLLEQAVGFATSFHSARGAVG